MLETKDIRVAILGSVNVGKSSLVGVLSKGIKDDGNGYARSFVLKHKHEKNKGQTSDISVQLMGFSNKEQVLPTMLNNKIIKNFREIASKSTHRLMLVDLCGHEKYLKTTISGVIGQKPNLILLIISASDGILKMTREHLAICIALKLPFAIIITKIDLAPPKIFEDTKKKINKFIQKAKLRKYVVTDTSNIENISKIVNNSIVPIFEISNTTNEGIPLLRNFLAEYTHNFKYPNKSIENESDNNEQLFQINSVYSVPGVGIVVGGIFEKGKKISVGDKFMLGPGFNKEYTKVIIKSIHSQCIPTDCVFMGQNFTLGLANAGKKNDLKRSKILKGSVLISHNLYNKLNIALNVNKFKAEIKILHHHSTIRVGYSPVLHIDSIKQYAKIIAIYSMNGEPLNYLMTGNKGIVVFKFRKTEFLQPGKKLLFRDGGAKGIGTIIETY